MYIFFFYRELLQSRFQHYWRREIKAVILRYISRVISLFNVYTICVTMRAR